MAVAPPIVSDGLRERIEPLPPKRQRRFGYPPTDTSRDKLSFAREADNVIFPRCVVTDRFRRRFIW